MDDQPGLPFNPGKRPMPDGAYKPRASRPSLDTRARALLKHVLEGKARTQQERILILLIEGKPMTRNEIESYFESDTPRIRITSVCGRVKELIDLELVEVADERACEITGEECETLKAGDDFVIMEEETVIS